MLLFGFVFHIAVSSFSFIPFLLQDIIGDRHPVVLAINKIDILPDKMSTMRLNRWVQRQAANLELVSAIKFKDCLLVGEKLESVVLKREYEHGGHSKNTRVVDWFLP